MFEQYLAAWKYAGFIRWVFRFNPPAFFCLAIALLFGAVGSMAQETSELQGPFGVFESYPSTHDGMSPFTMAVGFNEAVVGFAAEDILVSLEGEEDAGARAPRISGFGKDPANDQRYTFTLTPQAPFSFTVNIKGNSFQVLSGNLPLLNPPPSVLINYDDTTLPTADAGDDLTVVSGTRVELDGSRSTSDHRRTIASYAWTRTGGTGDSAVVLTGADTARPGFTTDALAPGADSVTHVFSLTVTDDAGSESVADTVMVTITSLNAAPVANAGGYDSFASGGGYQFAYSGAVVQLDGSKSWDRDGTIESYSWERISGTGDSTVVLNNADTVRPSFTADTLAPGAKNVRHVFWLWVTDNEGGASATYLTVEVEAPIADLVADAGPDQTVNSGAVVELDGSGSISDRRNRLDYAWTRTGGSGDDSVVLIGADTALLSFMAENLAPGAEDVTHIFSLGISDYGRPVPVTDTVTVTVTAGNAPPVANAGEEQTVHPGAMVQLDGTGSSDGDGTVVSYSWERTGGTGDDSVVLIGTNTAQLSFTAESLAPGVEDVTHVFSLIVTDDDGVSSRTDSVTVTITEPNAIPDVDAGPNQTVASGTKVYLDGTGSSDRDGAIAVYRWKRIGGSADRTAVLIGANTVRPSFTADKLAPGDADVKHIFSLTVRDNEGYWSDVDEVTVTVTAPNIVPVADAGPDQTVASGATVWLDGGGSLDRDGAIKSYTWKRTDGTGNSAVVLAGANTVYPSFRADTLTPGAADVTYIFSLIVSDDDGVTSAVDTVRVTVNAPMAAPVAIAGSDQTVASGAMVQLDGRGSSTDRRRSIGTYNWERVGGTHGSAVVLTGADTALPSFRANTLPAGSKDVTHVFWLFVTDNDGGTSADFVTVTITAPIAAPIADAGLDQTVASGAMIELDGRGSTSDRRKSIVSYAWTRTGGTGNDAVVLTGADMDRPSFTADTLAPGAADVTHTFSLVVTDDDGVVSVADTMTVWVTTGNVPPVAVAGPNQTVASGATVQLDGSGSFDSDGTIIVHNWVRVNTGLNTAYRTGARPSFRAPILAPGAADVTYVWSLNVRDDEGHWSADDEVAVTVTAPNLTPNADAGPDQSVASGVTVRLDGSGSLDNDGTVATYDWKRTGGSGNDAVVLTGTDTARPSFAADALLSGTADVTHIFSLIVTDDEGDISGTDTVTVTVTPPNAAPVADAGSNQTVSSGAMVRLDGSGSSDREGKIASYSWKRTGGSGTDALVLTGADTVRPSFTAGALAPGAHSVTQTFSLVVRDDQGFRSAADTITVTVVSPNATPVADAGTNQTVASVAMVQLDGSGSSDSDGTIASYSWERIGGTGDSALILAGADTAWPNFVAEPLSPGAADVTHTFWLFVTDNDGGNSADFVSVTVTSPNAAPVADAGPDLAVASGAMVELDGRGSTSDHRRIIASYAWTRMDGLGDSNVDLSDADTARPSFTAETLAPGAADVTHTFSLVVTDDAGVTSVADTITVRVTVGNVPPVADVGPDQTVSSGANVHLDGSNSFDPDGTIAGHAWSGYLRIGNRQVKADPTSGYGGKRQFTAVTLNPGDADATYFISLVVGDNDSAVSSKDTMTVTVLAPTAPPVADAGPNQSVASGSMVYLDGRGSSDSDGTVVSYNWIRTGGSGNKTVVLTDADTVRPSFTADALAPGTADVIHIFSLVVTDDEGAESVAETVTVTVTARPVANAGPDQTVASGTTVRLDGSRSSTDRRRNIASYAWTRASGSGDSRVSLSRADTARPSFTAETLAPGAADVTHVFSLIVTDDEGAVSETDSVTVTVTVENVRPVADAGPDQMVASGVAVQLDGSDSTDSDGMIATYAWTWTGGSGDSPVVLTGANTARPSFTANTLSPGAADVTHVFSLVVTDDDGAVSVVEAMTVTVTAKNVHPVADAGPDQRVPSGSLVRIDGRGSSDSDGTIASYSWTRTGGTGDRAVVMTGANTARPFFTAEPLDPGAADVTHVFSLVVTDDEGGVSAPDTVIVTASAPNALPVADAGKNQFVGSGMTVALDGGGSSDMDGKIASYRWRRIGGSGRNTVVLTSANTARPSFTAETLAPGVFDVTHVFFLTVTDNGGGYASDTVMVTVTSPNAAPDADAGEDQTVASGAAVQLDGRRSADSDGMIASFAWTRTGGTGDDTVTLSDADTARPFFTAETLASDVKDVTHVFTLVVTDNEGERSEVDSVTVKVTAGNAPPIADAGADQTVTSGMTVQLDGSGSSDFDGTIASYSWGRIGGSGDNSVVLIGADTSQPNFTADTLAPGAADVTHTFFLVVTDDDGVASVANTMTVRITVGNVSPVADAGRDQTVATGVEVRLDGRGSTDSDGTIESFAWTRTGGTVGNAVVLTGANTAQLSFMADPLTPGAVEVIHVFSLIVTDDEGAKSLTDTVTVFVISSNADPVANAGKDQTVASGAMVKLDGSGSTSDRRRKIAYRWTRTGGTIGASVDLVGSDTASPSFKAGILASGAADVTHVFTLVVTDDEGAVSAPETVTVKVIASNAVPIADAGPDQTVAYGGLVNLDASGSSDSDGAIAHYTWVRGTGESARLSYAGNDPYLTRQVYETTVYSLVVRDNKGAVSDSDTMTVTVLDSNAAPEVDAGEDQLVVSGATVRLDGNGSSDIDGRIATYAWTRTGGTGDDAVVLTGASTAQPSFTADALAPGADSMTHVFSLIVTDDDGEQSAADTVTVTITAKPIANAGRDRIVDSGRRTHQLLLGSGIAAPGGRIVSYRWTRTGGSAAAPAYLLRAYNADMSFPVGAVASGAPDVTHVFSLVVTDAHGVESEPDTVTVTVTAPEERPVADAGPNQTVTSGSVVLLDGSGSTDSDGTIEEYVWTLTGGTGARNIFAIGDRNNSIRKGLRQAFTADILSPGDDDVTHVFRLRVVDNDKNLSLADTPRSTMTVTVAAPNVPPVADAGEDQTVTSGAVVHLDGSGSTDRDGRVATYSWEWIGGTGDRSVVLTGTDTARPSFTADTLSFGAAAVTHVFTLIVTDEDGESSAETVAVTVVAPNAVPYANSGENQTVASGEMVQLDGSRSWDFDGSIATYAWTRTGGTGDSAVVLTGTDTAWPSFTADTLSPGAFDVTHFFSLIVTDDEGVESEVVSVKVTITSPNADPVANAGDDQTVASGETVVLDGRRSSDLDGTIASYSWSWAGGTGNSAVVLNRANSRQPFFTADTLSPGAADVTHVFLLFVTDNEGGTSGDFVTVTVEAPFAAPIADAGLDQTVVSGSTVQLDGSGSTSDRRRGLDYIWTRSGGTNGASVTLSDMSAARPYFTADVLSPGAENVTHVFSLNVTDDAGDASVDMVTVMVEAPNAVPIADAGEDQTVASGTRVELDGRGSTDRDGTVASYVWTRTGGTSGASPTLSDAKSARPSFTADTLSPGAADVTHEFTLTVTDDEGRVSVADTVAVTVTTGNVPPVANAGEGLSVASGAEVELDGSGSSDSDGTIAAYDWLRMGGSGDSAVVLTGANTARPNFTADTLVPGAVDVTHVFSLVVTDDDGETSGDLVTVTVEAPFAVPVANAGPYQTVASGATVELDGSGSTSDRRRSLDYAWERTDGTEGASVTLSDASAEQTSFTADTLSPGAADVTHVFMLTVTDDAGETSTDTVTVMVEAPFAASFADAGDDQTVASGMEVILDGSSSTSDRRRTIASYAWQRTGGTVGSVTLSDASVAQPSFTTDTLSPGAADVTHVFTLTVTDDAGETSTDMVTVTVEAPFAVPVADAGENQTVDSGTSVTLDGSGSTSDRRRTIVSYAWEPTGGTEGASVALSDSSAEQTSFTTEGLSPGAADVTHVFMLTVTDDAGEISTDTVTVMVEAPFSAPFANAGDDQTVDSGTSVTLDGSGSTSDRRRTIASYAWARTGGTEGAAVALSDASAEQTSFTTASLPPGAADVMHIFMLTVTDDAGEFSTEIVTVTVEASFLAPVADAGEDQTVLSGATVQLNGIGSTSDHRSSLDYFWARTGGTEGATIALSDASAEQTSFTTLSLSPGAADVTHVFMLAVTDDAGETSTDTVTVMVEAPFAAPSAEAGDDRTVASGTSVTLDGSGSIVDRRRTIVSWAWERTDGGERAAESLSDANTATPTFKAINIVDGDADVTHVFRLTVRDSAGEIDTDTVTIKVTAGNVPPFANAGNDREVASGTPVTLDGSGSTVDRRRTITSYAWARTGGTGGPVTLSDTSVSRPTFTAVTLEAGAADVTYVFTLTVTDNVGETDTDTVTVTVESPFMPTVVEVGPDQMVASGSVITLDGSGSTSDPRRPIFGWMWIRTGGTAGGTVIPTKNGIRSTFKADTLAPGAAAVTHEFTLIVVHGGGISFRSDDVVTVTVIPNAPPVANAGPNQTVVSGTTVTLDGTGSTTEPGRTITSYAWAQTVVTGGIVTLSDPSMAQPTFTAKTLVPGSADITHVIELTVTDNVGDTSSDTVTVTIESPFKAPDANGGPNQTVGSGMEVTLYGKGSRTDPRSSTISYAWTRTGGTGGSVTLSDASVAQPTFTADTLAPGAADVTHVFNLTVTDSKGNTDTDTVTIKVTSPLAVLVANAGPDQPTVASGITVTLDGTGSTTDRRRTIESYAWQRTSGTGGSVTLSSISAAQPTFTADTLTSGAADVTHVFTLTVTDSAGEIDTDTVTVIVEAPFAVPIADAGRDWRIYSGTTVVLDGSGSTTDRRRTIASYAWTRTGGTGNDALVLSGANRHRLVITVENLSPDAANVTHEFSLVVTDTGGAVSEAATVTVTVIPGNARPVADAGPDLTVSSGAFFELDGSGSSDSDGAVWNYSWSRVLASGFYTVGYGGSPRQIVKAETLAPGAADVIHIFSLRVIDDKRAYSAPDTMTVTVIAPNAVPNANGGENQTVASGEIVQLDGSDSWDLDGSIATYAWSRIGGTGDSAVVLNGADTAWPSFTADTLSPGAFDVTHDFSLIVTDDEGVESEADTVKVTVTSPNADPVANAGYDQTVASGETVLLDGRRSSDLDGTIASYSWSWAGGTGNSAVVLNRANSRQPFFTADTLSPGAADVTHVFLLFVTDNEGGTSGDFVTVTVEAPFAAPIADAGLDQTVVSGSTVQLDGSGSTSDRRRGLDYIWTRSGGTNGASVTLSDMSAARPYFTADVLSPGAENVTHVFSLNVTDDAGDASVDMVTVMVEAPNAVPIADAGEDQTVASGTRVELDGRGSTDRDGTVASYVWTRTGGTSGASPTLSDAKSARPSFTADTLSPGAADVTHEFTLTVTDDEGRVSVADTVAVTVTTGNVPPVANAGEGLSVASGAEVELDGSGSSDSDGTIAAYDWLRMGGSGDSAVVLTGANTARPNFTADTLVPGAVDVTHVFSLVVTDDDGETSGDLVTVTVEAPFAVPVANAGPYQTVASGATVELDGSGSTSDRRRSLDYAWERTDGTEGASVTLGDASAEQTSFTADTLSPGAADVTHVFMLTVTDDAGETSTDTVTVMVEAPFAASFADAGDDQTVASGMEVILDGSSSTSDRRRTIASYAWQRTGGTVGSVTLSDASAAQPSFTTDTLSPGAADVTHVFTLTVTDDAGETSTDMVTVTVEAPFAVPVADAGENQTVDSGTSVTLDGSGSTSDRRRTIVSYAWEPTGGTEGASVALSDSSAEQTSFTTEGLSPGAADVTHVFMLTVTDDAGEISTDTVTVMVEAPFSAPFANAGDDQTVDSGTSVTLDGSGSTSDRRRTIASYVWERTGGTEGAAVALSDASAEQTSFTTVSLPPGAADVTHIFMLTVTDDAGEFSTEIVTVTVEASFLAPVADAGEDQTVLSGATVQLNGIGSTSDHRSSLDYFWARTGGTEGATIALSDASAEQTSFTTLSLSPGAADVTHVFMLAVTDDAGETSTDTVTVMVEAPFAAPSAEAGDDRTVASGTSVTLDGSGSIVDRRRTIVSWAWERTDGGERAAESLSDANTATPTFKAINIVDGDADVTHVFRLTVRDSAGEIDTDTVTIKVAAGNVPPFANAGNDREVASGTPVTLDGSGSTVDRRRTITSYAWARTGGTGGPVTLSDTSVSRPTFTAVTLEAGAADVTYVFTLTVTDNVGETDTDTVTVTVESPFTPTVVEVGPDQMVASGSVITLDGSGSTSDPRRPIFGWMWIRTGGTAGGTVIPTKNGIRSTFKADTLAPGAAAVTHEFTLIVVHGGGISFRSDDVVTVTVIPNAPPVANAGPNQTVVSGTTVTLDGTGSTTEPGRTITSYAWAQTVVTGGIVTLSDPSMAQPTFTAKTLAPGSADITHVIELTVTDNVGDTSSDTVTVTIESPFKAPDANGGPNQTVGSGMEVTLYGQKFSLTF